LQKQAKERASWVIWKSLKRTGDITSGYQEATSIWLQEESKPKEKPTS